MTSNENSKEVIVAQEFNRIRGKLCGIIESWGVPEKQERGMIQVLKTITYDSEKTITSLLSE